MKKMIFMSAFWLVSMGLVYAQIGIEKTKKVKQDEVPSVVQSSLQHDFDLSSADGNWSLQYLESSNGSTKRTILKPLEYVFHQRKDGDDIEIRFTPDGVLRHAKGIEKSTVTTDSKS